ncbi:RodZ domain-containing protein [Colwellia sp. RE-S-Sl-9]
MSKKLPEVEETEVQVEVSGPGSMLAEARIKKGLSIDDVASSLNIRVALVKNIEADIFDQTLPDTYNRGYIKNYAKLVNLPVSDIIAYYEKLNILEVHSTKMQSFSRGTMKKAENSMLMWITYLILTVFIGLTVMWWLQDDKEAEPKAAVSSETLIKNTTNSTDIEEVVETTSSSEELSTTESVASAVGNSEIENELDTSNIDNLEQNASLESVDAKAVTSTESDEITLSKVIFTFSGDCWVNIHDALGERIAWGIKKSGYVMTIEAKAPLNITIGKPELVQINFNGESIDMSTFPQGHIAKFELPLLSQS